MNTMALAPGAPGRWLVSRDWDLAVFGGSALLSLVLLAWGAMTGVLAEATPAWAWILTVVLVDVAHVWATAYRVYADPEELRRRPWLYGSVPGLFPGSDQSPGPEALALIVPLLALPQATHYVLDGWIWRARGNPRLRERLGF